MDPKLFRKLPVSGDGSCFFHSLVTIFHVEKKGKIDPVPNIKKRSKELRKQCVEWLEKNLNYKVKGTGLSIREEINDALVDEGVQANKNDNDPKYTSLKEYLEYMKDTDGYAGQIEIYAIAELYQRNIRVFNKNGNKLNNMGLGYEINNNSENDIFLFHNFKKKLSAGLHHFEPLIPKKILESDKPKQSNKPKQSDKPKQSYKPKRSDRSKRSNQKTVRRVNRKNNIRRVDRNRRVTERRNDRTRRVNDVRRRNNFRRNNLRRRNNTIRRKKSI